MFANFNLAGTGLTKQDGQHACYLAGLAIQLASRVTAGAKSDGFALSEVRYLRPGGTYKFHRQGGWGGGSFWAFNAQLSSVRCLASCVASQLWTEAKTSLLCVAW